MTPKAKGRARPPFPWGPAPRNYSSQAPLRGGAAAVCSRGWDELSGWDTQSGLRGGAMAAWGDRLAGVRGVLLDISGVLYDSGEGGGRPIAGSVDAVAR